MKQNILIIGGSYFIGRVFVEELLKLQKFSIYVLNRGKMPLRKKGVCEIRCDRHKKEQLKQRVPPLNWHAVVDFCAYKPADISDLMSALPDGCVKQYIYISTASVYEKSDDFPIKEDHPKLSGPQSIVGEAGEYAYLKWLTEMELQNQADRKGIHFTSLRPAFIYGKYNYAPRESYFFNLIKKKETIILPDKNMALFSLVSVWDTAEIILGCIGNKDTFSQAFNVSAEELVSYSRLLDLIQTVTGESADVRRVSIKEIIDQRIPLPFPLEEHLIYCGDKIKKVLDFRYMKLLKGIKMTYPYFLRAHGLK